MLFISPAHRSRCDLRQQDSKREFLSGMLALEQVLVFRNQYNPICMDKELFRQKAQGITNAPGFDRFADEFDNKTYEDIIV